MLADALVERYSRQILLPEIGGRGQERLCATRAVVAGRGVAARIAARLLDAAGLDVELRDGDAVDVTVGDAGVVRARDRVVATLVGRPCGACADDLATIGAGRVAHDADAARYDAPTARDGASVDDAAAPQALGALVAAEAIRVALGLARACRVHAVDVAGGTFAARELERTAGCPACVDTP